MLNFSTSKSTLTLLNVQISCFLCSIIYVSEIPDGNDNVTLKEGKVTYSFNVTEFNATEFQEIDPGK